MTTRTGSRGRMEIFEDFFSYHSSTVDTVDKPAGPQVMYCSVNEGTFDMTVDEPGGIIAATTDTSDNDNIAFYIGPFKAADGGCVMEARFKSADVSTNATFCGFSELLDATTPVCPIEASGATPTLTLSSSGATAGMLMDADCSTQNWNAVAGDDSVSASGSPTAGGQNPGDDAWDVCRVEVDPDGTARCYLGKNDGGLEEVKSFSEALTTSVVLYAVLLCENRSGAANTLEVDYMYAKGWRDWTN